jgi:hypothetical protein
VLPIGMEVLKKSYSHVIAKGESATDFPKCKLIGFNIGKRMGVLLHNRVLQMVHSPAVVNVERKRLIRHVENPTEKRDGAGWIVHRFAREA